MEGTSDTWKVPQIHGWYLRYMDGTSDTWKVPQIHGRYLRYIDLLRKVVIQSLQLSLPSLAYLPFWYLDDACKQNKQVNRRKISFVKGEGSVVSSMLTLVM